MKRSDSCRLDQAYVLSIMLSLLLTCICQWPDIPKVLDIVGVDVDNCHVAIVTAPSRVGVRICRDWLDIIVCLVVVYVGVFLCRHCLWRHNDALDLHFAPSLGQLLILQFLATNH